MINLPQLKFPRTAKRVFKLLLFSVYVNKTNAVHTFFFCLNCDNAEI